MSAVRSILGLGDNVEKNLFVVEFKQIICSEVL